jgi:hypothetical protein
MLTHTTPGTGVKFRVGMDTGMAEKRGYGLTHFWVWPNTRVLGMDRTHKILEALKVLISGKIDI